MCISQDMDSVNSQAVSLTQESPLSAIMTPPQELTNSPLNQQNLQENLQLVQNQLNQILEYAIASLLCFRVYPNQDWEYQYFSQGCLELFGYTEQEMILDKNLWLSRVFPEDVKDIILPGFAKIFAEESFHFEYRFYHKDGTLRWISSFLTSQYDPLTNSWNVTAIDTDISQRKQLEIALKNSEAKLNNILNNAQAAIGSFKVFANEQWECEHFSEGCQVVFGYSSQELIKNPTLLLSRIMPEDWENIVFPASQNIHQEKNITIEYRFYHKDDKIRWISSTLSSRQVPLEDCWYVTTVAMDISDRKQVENTLREKEEQLRILTDSLPVCISYVDKNERYQFVNKTYEIWWQKSREYISGKTVKEILGQDAYEVVEDKIKQVLSGLSINYEAEISSNNTEKRYISAALVPDFDENHQVRGYYALITDISEHKKVELTLRKNELQLKEAQRVAQVGSWELDVETLKITWSEEAFRLFGFNPNESEPSYEEHLAKIYPDDRELVQEAVNKMISSGNPYCVEFRVFKADGTLRYIEGKGEVIVNQSGIPSQLVGTLLDITERKTIEENLRKSEEIYRNLAKLFPNGAVHLFDLNLKYFLTEGSVLEKLGLSNDMFEGKTMWEIFPPENCKILDFYYRKVLEGESHNFELLWQHYYFMISVTPLRNDKGEIIGGIAVSQEITDRKRVEESLQKQAQREQALNRVIQTIRNSLDLTTIFEIAVSEIAQLLEVERVTITKYIAEKELWRVVSDYHQLVDIPDILGMEFTQGDHSVYDQLKNQPFVLINNTLEPQEENVLKFAKIFHGDSLIIPLTIESELWGILTLLSHKKSPWQESEISLASAVADQLAIAIHQSELYQDLQEANEELSRLASLDGLTQIPNRRRFDEYLNLEWRRLRREKKFLSLIFLDVDYFKRYNDTYGHLAGDDCLKQIAQVLTTVIHRPADLIARYGGEEFAIILPHTNIDGALHIAGTVLRRIQNLKIPHSQSLIKPYVTVSIGVASIIPTLELLPQDLIHAADQSLYLAKKSGRDRISIKS
jgi:diguanylate cyclase (GGDEF)-like protein/PAS domain S-box-containing protein